MEILLEFDFNGENLLNFVYDALVEDQGALSLEDMEKFLRENKMGIEGPKREEIFIELQKKYAQPEDPGVATIEYMLNTFKIDKVAEDLLGLTSEENQKLLDFIKSSSTK